MDTASIIDRKAKYTHNAWNNYQDPSHKWAVTPIAWRWLSINTDNSGVRTSEKVSNK
jgi:hypothetical protein